MKDKFKKTVESGDIIDVRLFLSNELMLDPRGASFHEMLSYAESQLDGLFVPDNGHRSEKEAALWDKEFLYQIKNELDDNFSREKLNYYVHVAKQVLKDKARLLDEEEAKQKQHSEKQEGTQNRESLTLNRINHIKEDLNNIKMEIDNLLDEMESLSQIISNSKSDHIGYNRKKGNMWWH